MFSRLGVEIREMRKDDVDFCLSLLRIVGWWNTREEVERMMHHEPNGCFVARARLGEMLPDAEVGLRKAYSNLSVNLPT